MDTFKIIQESFRICVPIGCIKSKDKKKLMNITCDAVARLHKPGRRRDVTDFELIDGSKHTGTGYEKQYGQNILFVPHGEGQNVTPLGHIAIGCWVHGIFNGYGGYRHPAGFSYAGNFTDGKFNGHGVINFPDTPENKIHVVDCQWYENYPVGNGAILYTDGAKYVGMIHNFDKDGKGILTYPDGTIIQGSWPNAIMDGEFTIISSVGKICIRYNKGIKSDCMRQTLTDGTKYVGKCNNLMQPHGKGKVIEPDGTTYVGSFVNGLKEGHGVLKNSNGTYRGFFTAGKKNGYGFMLMSNGDYYNGYWLDDKFHGCALVYHKHKSCVIEYIFDNDCVVGKTGRSHYY